MKEYRVRYPDEHGDSEDSYWAVKAFDHEQAAEKYMEELEDSGDGPYNEPIEVVVTDEKGVSRTFSVRAEYSRDYYAQEVTDEDI